MTCNDCDRKFNSHAQECMRCIAEESRAFDEAKRNREEVKLNAMRKMYKESIKSLNKALHGSGTFEGGPVLKCENCTKAKSQEQVTICYECLNNSYKHHQLKAEPIPEADKSDITPVSEAQAEDMLNRIGVWTAENVIVWRKKGFIIIKEKPIPLDNCPFCGNFASILKSDKGKCSCTNLKCPCRRVNFTIEQWQGRA